MAWFKDNAQRGVPLASLLKQLKLKGFVPCKNDLVGLLCIIEVGYIM
jgi:hypothetical protein